VATIDRSSAPPRPNLPDPDGHSPSPSAGESWFSRLSQYLALYVVYVFIAGWAFRDFYLRDMGLSPRWLDFSLYEVLVSGFTILFTGGRWLWPLYLLVFLIPTVLEVWSWRNRALIRVLSTILLLALLFPIYFVSRVAGVRQAQIDKTSKISRLPVITFSSKEGKKYVGRLLYLKNGTYFIREVRSIDAPFGDDVSLGLVLSIYRAEEIHDVKVVGYP